MNKDTYIARINKAKKLAEDKNIDGLWITKPENKYYLSGFESSNFFIYLTKERNYLLTDFRYIELARSLETGFETVMLTNQYTALDFLRENCPGTLGIEYKSITFDFYNDMMEKVKPGNIVSADQIIESIRIIKEKQEIDAVKSAAEIANLAFVHILDFIKPGVTERDIALELEFFMRHKGADALAFDTIAASGERGSLPHAVPSSRALKNGDFVTLDFGAKWNGYCSDMTRTVGLGAISAEQKNVYRIVLEAQKAASAVIAANVSASVADSVAREMISGAGYGEYFGHGLGHGVGLEIHEAPTLNALSKDVLKTDMTVTIEPGIYIPGKFGVRIEDLAVVTDNGIISLSTVDKELIII